MKIRKEPKRKMKLHLACNRAGKPKEEMTFTWVMPEAKAMEVYIHFSKCLQSMLQAEGLLGGKKK